MTRDEWVDIITANCKEAGTYAPYYGLAIDQLAEIMETRDRAKDQFEKTGGNPMVSYTNKGGFTNYRKNPALAIIEECNKQALAYWRDLGLTPSGFKKLDGAVIKKQGGGFADLLSKIDL